ncbi:MAG TPA: hypothetical protein VGC76_11700 [Pyrinomonadaceae bacterium]|jgi:hypothetical protein
MKKFQLQITIEQKESWRVSQIENAESPPDSANVTETASLLIVEKTNNCSPAAQRGERLFQSFSGYINRFIKNFRQAGRKEK